MKPFTYQSSPVRVVFGRGTLAQIGKEVVKIGKSKALILTTPYQGKDGQHVVDLITSTKDEAGSSPTAILYDGAVMHTPVEVTEKALKVVKENGIDCLIALGGGSSIGLSKALAYRTNLPQIVIPTTYAGSEATPILGQTEGKEKKTLKSPSVLPGVIVYDVDLTHTLPKEMIITSGVNAIAHSVEALYSADSNPVIDQLAIEGIKVLMASIPVLAGADSSGDRSEAQEQALYGAWLCGTCLGNVGMALHHKICHTLGGTLNTPHAQTHCVMLPHALQYNYSALSAPVKKNLRRAFEVEGDDEGGAVLAQKIYDVSKNSGGPVSLKELDVKESDLDMVVQKALGTPYPNPAPLVEDRLRKMLQRAWAGTRPSAGL
ncbi:hypothetical protein CBS101457_006917 [Exobasidium rhododendri]|nr:hypothetical protein CBS101457_006917 [Exobasidium rhododendri]